MGTRVYPICGYAGDFGGEVKDQRYVWDAANLANVMLVRILHSQHDAHPSQQEQSETHIDFHKAAPKICLSKGGS